MDIFEFCYLGRTITCMQWTQRMHTHREEACSTAAQTRLPVYGVAAVLATSAHVHRCYDYQVDAHAEVRKGQVAHQETRNSQFAAAA